MTLGDFTIVGGMSANYIASWNGSSWSPLGSGMNGPVDALMVYNDNLLVGGEFTSAGGKVSTYIAQWTPAFDFICGDLNDDDALNIIDIIFLINYRYKDGSAPIPQASADVNNDELLNILDIVYLINYKYKEGPEPNCPQY